MSLILIVAGLFAGLYLIIICSATIQWSRESTCDLSSGPIKKVSVVVIARNEELSIKACLESIAANNYNKQDYEIILMDDHSEDKTVAIAESLDIDNLRVLRLADYNLESFNNSYKKAGQYYAIKESKHDVILQTDGDCVCPANWIEDMTAAMSQHEIVTGPILIKSDDSFLSKWQTFEIIGTMVITYAGIRSSYWQSANAANMIYKKNIYQKFAEEMDKDVASGDDIFLINWAYENGDTIGYNKSNKSIVITEAEVGFSNLFAQRLRWATKTKKYSFLGLKLLMTGFFLFHLLILMLGFCSIFWSSVLVKPFIITLLAKWLGDIILLLTCAPFFKERYSLILSPIFSVAHTLYVVLIGVSGALLNDYKWKGRTVR